jgi:hypothetical protein
MSELGHESGDVRLISARECARLLSLAAPAFPVIVDKDDRRRGPCARAKLDGAESVQYAYLFINGVGRVALHLFPGDTLTQARALYREPGRAARLMTLAGLGWDLQPNFHFGAIQESVVYTRSRLGIAEYMQYWAARISKAAVVQRSDWGQAIDDLTAAGMFNASDQPEFDRHFTNTNRQRATLRPGIFLSREWDAASSRVPGFPEDLRTAIWQALNALGERTAAATGQAAEAGNYATAQQTAQGAQQERASSAGGATPASAARPAGDPRAAAKPTAASGSQPLTGSTRGNTAVIQVAIRQDHAPGTFGVEIVSSPAGEAAATVVLDVDDLLARRESLQWAVLASAVARRRVLSETERPVIEIGKLLFTALLGTGEVSGRYQAAGAVAAERGQRLRVVLRIDAPTLAALPWEAMYDEAAGAYVCRQDQLLRHIGVASMSVPLPVRPPLRILRILGIISSPRGLPALDVDKEKDHLVRALERPVSQGTVELHWASAATWAELHGMLFGGPWHVVHFIGHGDFDPAHDEGFLVLADDDGRARRVAAHRMVDLLRQGNPMPRLVVLNSCAGAQASSSDLFSGTAAALVRGGVSAVAAMQYEISDNAAIAFARGFYTAIAHGRGIDEALSSGRVAILGTSDHTLEWLTPVLYLRGRDMNLFAVH